MKGIRLNFYNFGQNFDKEDNIFVNIIARRYTVKTTSDTDYCIYAPFGNDHHKFDGIRIF